MAQLSKFESLQLAAILLSSSGKLPQASKQEMAQAIFDLAESIKEEDKTRNPPQKARVLSAL